MASAFGADEALRVFKVIDVNGNGYLSKLELQTYCASNSIQWSSVVTAMQLHRFADVKVEAFLAAAAEGKLGIFATTGDHGLVARNLMITDGSFAWCSSSDGGSDTLMRRDRRIKGRARATATYGKMTEHELRAALADRDEELTLLRAPWGCTIFLGVKFNRAWGVITLFFEGHGPELIRLGMAFQSDIDELNRLMHLWMLDPRVWTRKSADGFDYPPNEVLLATAPEPGLSLRRAVMVKLQAMQAGILIEFCEHVDKISEMCFSVLLGPVYKPDAAYSDFEKGYALPSCFAGKSGRLDVPENEWTPEVAAALKKASKLIRAAQQPNGKQIPCVSNPRETAINRTRDVFASGNCNYMDYQYASAICMAAKFAEHMTAIYADEAATVLIADMKTQARYTAKVNEYSTEGKSSPRGQHVKDVLRCLVQVAGHPEMKRAHAVLKTKCNVRSTKNRIVKGTHDLLCIIELADGLIAEVQIGFTSIVAMKALAHEPYKYKRVPTDDLEKAMGLSPLFKHAWHNLPSIYKDGKFIAGYEAVTKEELTFVSLV
jgi:hypothetical protein